jgi:hypothetical protein
MKHPHTDLTTPYTYERWKGGVYRRDPKKADHEGGIPHPESKGHVSEPVPEDRQPFLQHIYSGQLNVPKTAIDVATDEHWVQVQCAEQGADLWLPREICASNTQLAKQSAHGFDFRSHSCARSVDFIMASTQEHKPVKMSSRQGAVTLTKAGIDKHGWVLGDEWIGPKGTKVYPYPNKNSYAAAIAQEGDLDTWLRAFSQIVSKAGVVARWLTFGMFAAPLLRWANYRTFIVHHYGQTSGGKSALADFGASIYGRAKEEGEKPKLVGSFNATAMAIVEQFREVDDLPTIIDELQGASFKNHSGQIMNLIMQIVLGQSRKRLTPSGQLAQKPVYWRSVVRFTGEQPLLGNSSLNLGGATNRIIQIRADAMESADARALHQWMERTRCYGVAGKAFLRALVPLVNNPERVASLREQADSIHDEIERRTGSTDQRMAHLAIIALAQALATKILFKVPYSQGRSRAIEDALNIAQIADLGEQETYQVRTWDFLRQHIASEPGKYLDLSDSTHRDQILDGRYPEIVGVLNRSKRERMWFVPSRVNALLRRNDYNPDRFWSDMQQEGRLVTTNGGKNLTPERNLGKFRARVYIVRGEKGAKK